LTSGKTDHKVKKPEFIKKVHSDRAPYLSPHKIDNFPAEKQLPVVNINVKRGKDSE